VEEADEGRGVILSSIEKKSVKSTNRGNVREGEGGTRIGLLKRVLRW